MPTKKIDNDSIEHVENYVRSLRLSLKTVPCVMALVVEVVILVVLVVSMLRYNVLNL